MRGRTCAGQRDQTYTKREKDSLDIIELMGMFCICTPKSSLEMYLMVEI